MAGGELFYEFLGSAGGSSTYRITLRLFRDSLSTGPLLENERVEVGIYQNESLYGSPLPLPLQGSVSTISLNTGAFPCLVGDVHVSYEMAVYTNTVTLPDNQSGYVLSRVGCCRVDLISNLTQQRNVGSNYVTVIPGAATLPSGHNSSPQFLVRDTALVCANKPFTLDFGAVDPDRDSLTYSFCDAYTSGSASNNAPPPASLSLIPLLYASPFSGNYPLGQGVSINNQTGIISGIAPTQGQYVVNVCISEWRNGQRFTEHRKDFILKVQNCDFVEAILPPKIIHCDKYTVHFENQSTSSAITSYLWDFGNPSAPVNSSANPVVNHTYSDTGSYVARLTVTGPKGCVGTDSTLVLVYPGFTPGFTITGSCFAHPYVFKDATAAKYGVVDSWRWNFGEEGTSADTSYRKTAQYKYGQPGNHTISLVVTSSKGCIDSLHKDLVVLDKPMLHLPFKDTLICSIDTLPISVPGNGSFSWLPNNNILFGNTAHPLVFPKDTTRYIVTVNENGCVNTDTVTVNVLNFITVQLRPDTTICKTDSVTIRPLSQALSYRWAPAGTLKDPLVKNPVAAPLTNTTYHVTANLGKCQATAQIAVRVVPYPLVSIITPDTVICYGSRIQLRSNITGTNFAW
ncbi:MAG: hypothetical protein NVSMB63_04530 [Sediminibacterium sp.]